MSTLRCALRTLITACIVVPMARPLAAQDSLRVLRFSPAALASVAEPVVITFDHPVAPRLDESVDPERAVRVLPDVGRHSYWRDPSTLVVEFDSLWQTGARYRVELDAGLRSAAGLPLARGAVAREVIVGGAAVLAVQQSRSGEPADTIVHPLAVYSMPVTLGELAGRATLLPDSAECRTREPIALRPVLVRAVSDSDSFEVRQAGGYDRDERADSLRRVVEFAASRAVGRGCVGRLRIGAPDALQKMKVEPLRVRPVFRAAGIDCQLRGYTSCPAGPMVLVFTAPVQPAEVRRHVRVDGREPRMRNDTYVGNAFALDSATPRSRHVVEVHGEIRSAAGERIDMAKRFAVEVAPPERGIGLSSGALVVPRVDQRLIAIRHGGVDSIIVIVARVVDSARVRALAHGRESYGEARLRWHTVIGDSLVLRYAMHTPLDSERVLVVPITDLPAAWRTVPMLAVRARAVKHDTLVARRPAETGRRRSPDGIRRLEPVFVTSDLEGDGMEPHFAIVRRTDLATHVQHAEGEVRVWVTGVRDARPRAGASLRMVTGSGEELGRGTTDHRGMASVAYRVPRDTGAAARRLILETRLGGDVDLHLLDASFPPWRRYGDDADDDGGAGVARDEPQAALHGAAFADRGIYRPGESVYLKGIARRNDPVHGYTAARGDSARWVVRWLGNGWRGEKVWTRTARLGNFGSTVDTFTVPRTARLGGYAADLELRRRGTWRGVAHAWFSVAEYRVPEFTVRASADSTTPLFAGDTARVRVEARYLFGLPMQGAKVEWWADLRESEQWDIRIAGLEGFSVGRSWWHIDRTAEQSVRGALPLTTDANGAVTVAVPVGALSRPGRVSISTTVTDENRQVILGNVSLPVQAADIYVGARFARARWVSRTGETIPMEALVVGLDGRRRAGVPVRLLALRYRWSGARMIADTVWRDERVSTADTMRVGYAPTASGGHELLLVARDARGREATTSLFTWVESPRQPWVSRTPADLPMSADKPRYAVGDRASIHVDAADDGPAWLTLTRDGTLSEQLVQLRRGGNVLSVVIPEGAVPRAEVTVLALRQIPAGDTSHVYTRKGQISLEVAHDAHALRVVLVPERTHYAPRERVRLALHVRDLAGRGVRAEAAVWAVDEGVASLTALAKPDLLDELLRSGWGWFSLGSSLEAFVPWLPPAVRSQYLGTYSSRSMSAGAHALLEYEASAGNGEIQISVSGRDPALRRFFATTPLYRGAVVTDANGDAAVEFELPDNLTTFHLYAAAVTEGVQAGSGDTTIVSSRVLAVRPALPRVIRDGDSVLAGALVTQDRDGRAPVTLSVEGTGLRIDGAASRRDTLDGRHPREIRFALRGIGGDTALLRFRGTTGTDGDAVEARLPVSPGGHPRASVVMGTLRGSANVVFPIAAALDTSRSRLELQLGSSALPMLRRLSESLRLYPYLCTEQLSSGGRALVARIRAEWLSGPTTPLTSRDRYQLELGVSMIIARQTRSGGFGYWSATNWSTPWLTAYALDFLVGARDLGIAVPASAIEHAEEYLASAGAPARERMSRYGRYGTAAGDTFVTPHDLLAAALAVRALQHPDTALERHVLALRRRLDWVDRLSLAQLLAARGDSGEARALLTDAWRATHTEGRRIVLDDSAAPRYWMFRSILRPAATLLTTAALLTPDDERLAPLFESLIQVGRSGSGWSLNTIDQALASDAVLAMLRRQGATTNGAVASSAVAVSAGGRALGTMTAGGARADTMRVPLAAALSHAGATGDSARIALRGSSDAAVYYAATLYEVPVARPVRADDEGISVERWYERFDDPRPTLSVREGELVRVRIRITVPRDREFVAVEDPLPAGLEAVDLSLRTSSSLPPYEGAPRLRAEERAGGPPGQRWLFGSWDGGWWTPWEHREIRDDRVVYFARQLWKGSYLVSYVARATTAGTFVRPPTHAEEMYNPAVHGRSDGGWFTVEAKP